jgi:hypothetical protein
MIEGNKKKTNVQIHIYSNEKVFHFTKISNVDLMILLKTKNKPTFVALI